MTSEEVKETKNSNCIICYGRIGVTSKTCIRIFDDNALTNSDKPIASVLNSVLQTPIDKENACSTVLCRKCLKLVNEVC